MLSIQQVLLDLSTAILAVGTGLVLFRKLNNFCRVLLLQTALYLIFDLTAYAAGKNAWMFNAYMLVETTLLFLAAWLYYNSRTAAYTLVALFAAFALVYMCEIFYTGFFVFAHFTAITQGVLFTGVFLFIILSAFMQKTGYSVVYLSGTSHYIKLENILKAQLLASDFIL